MLHTDFLVVRNQDARGNRVRPSNWAERLAGNAADFVGGRLRYDGRVQPCTACPGTVCLRVDRAIGEDKPYVVDTICSFMRMNNMTAYTGCPRVQSDPEPLDDALAA